MEGPTSVLCHRERDHRESAPCISYWHLVIVEQKIHVNMSVYSRLSFLHTVHWESNVIPPWIGIVSNTGKIGTVYSSNTLNEFIIVDGLSLFIQRNVLHLKLAHYMDQTYRFLSVSNTRVARFFLTLRGWNLSVRPRYKFISFLYFFSFDGSYTG